MAESNINKTKKISQNIEALLNPLPTPFQSPPNRNYKGKLRFSKQDIKLQALNKENQKPIAKYVLAYKSEKESKNDLKKIKLLSEFGTNNMYEHPDLYVRSLIAKMLDLTPDPQSKFIREMNKNDDMDLDSLLDKSRLFRSIPIYLINGHSSFSPIVKLQKINGTPKPGSNNIQDRLKDNLNSVLMNASRDGSKNFFTLGKIPNYYTSNTNLDTLSKLFYPSLKLPNSLSKDGKRKKIEEYSTKLIASNPTFDYFNESKYLVVPENYVFNDDHLRILAKSGAVVFSITAAPIGFDSKCGDDRIKAFLKAYAKSSKKTYVKFNKSLFKKGGTPSPSKKNITKKNNIQDETNLYQNFSALRRELMDPKKFRTPFAYESIFEESAGNDPLFYNEWLYKCFYDFPWKDFISKNKTKSKLSEKWKETSSNIPLDQVQISDIVYIDSNEIQEFLKSVSELYGNSSLYKKMLTHLNSELITSEVSPSFIPPGDPAYLKDFQFYDHNVEQRGRNNERWGVLELTALDNKDLNDLFKIMNNSSSLPFYNTLEKGTKQFEKKEAEIRKELLYPKEFRKSSKIYWADDNRMESLYNLIEESVANEWDVGLDDITQILGSGIYIDITCGAFMPKIYDERVDKNIKNEINNKVKEKLFIEKKTGQPQFIEIHDDLEKDFPKEVDLLIKETLKKFPNFKQPPPGEKRQAEAILYLNFLKKKIIKSKFKSTDPDKPTNNYLPIMQVIQDELERMFYNESLNWQTILELLNELKLQQSNIQKAKPKTPGFKSPFDRSLFMRLSPNAIIQRDNKIIGEIANESKFNNSLSPVLTPLDNRNRIVLPITIQSKLNPDIDPNITVRKGRYRQPIFQISPTLQQNITTRRKNNSKSKTKSKSKKEEDKKLFKNINTAINLSSILKESSPNLKSPSKSDLKNSPNTPKKKLRTRRKINYGNVTSRVNTRSQTRKTRSSTRKK